MLRVMRVLSNLLCFKNLLPTSLIFFLGVPLLTSCTGGKFSIFKDSKSVANTNPTQDAAAPTLNSNSNGNGITYDGKILVFHHFNSDSRHWCRGKETPEKIIYTNRQVNEEWFLLQAKMTDCEYTSQGRVENVQIDPVTNSAKLNGESFVAPTQIEVAPAESTDLSDTNLLDGICMTKNGFCSLRAAFEQASTLVETQSLTVRIPLGVYKISSLLEIKMPEINSSNELTISGVNSTDTVIDAQHLSQHLKVTGSQGKLNIEKIRFTRGLGPSPTESSTISSASFKSFALEIRDSVFTQNKVGHTLSISNLKQLNILRSQFHDNTGGYAIFTSFTPLTLEDSSIYNNTSGGLAIFRQIGNIFLRRSSIYGNQGTGINLIEGFQSNLENLTIHNNSTGLSVTWGDLNNNELNMNVNVTNSTITDNTGASQANIYFGLSKSTQKIVLANTVLSQSDGVSKNCAVFSGYSDTGMNMHSYNGIYSGGDCFFGGSGNTKFTPPLLGPLQDNGGLTLTRSPLIGSPLLNGGLSSLCPSADQRGYLRPHDGTTSCDVGSVELP